MNNPMEDEPFYNDDDDAVGEDEYTRSEDSDSESESESEIEGIQQISDPNDLGDNTPEGTEIEIEGDFDRLIANIRVSDGASGSNMMTRDWDFNIEENEAEFRDELRAASGIGRKRRKTGRQSGPVLSQQVKALVGEGNQAYVDADIPSAIRIMQEVIRIEPRAASAWAVLAQCYSDLNEPKKELQLRIMAAHLRHDAEEWERLARSSKDMGYNQQALYCYRKLYSLDPNNVDALWDRASLAKEMGDLRTARHSYLAILKRFPHDLTVLSELRPLLIELSDLQTCATLFQFAFEHYSSVFPIPFSASDPTSISSPFAQMEVLCLTDLYNTLGQYEHAIHAIKRGCRWLQGRAAEKFWDVCEDDREFDLTEGTEASAGEAGLGAGTHREREGDVRPGLYPLDVNARHRLAIARIKMGDIEEGKMHANIVLSQDLLDYSPLFVEISDAYFDREMYAEASPLYELLGEDAATSNFGILLNAAACRRMLGNMREAVDLYKTVIDADPTHNEAKMKLAELYEIMDEPRKALDLVYQVIDSRGRNKNQREQGDTSQAGGVAHTSLFEETPRSKGRTPSRKMQKLTPAQLRELEEQKEKDVLRGYKRVEELWPKMLDKTHTEPDRSREEAEREWIFEAEKLVEMFRETRMLFLSTRNNPFRGMLPRKPAVKRDDQADEDRMASRLELMEQVNNARKSKDKEDKPTKVDIFRGVSFDNWLKLFMQYSFQLTKRGQYEVADEVLRHISFSNAYQSLGTQDTIRYALIACAISTGRYLVVVEQCRKLITTHQFNNEPIRILLASLASGLRPTDSFIVSTLQKHMLRELKINDTAVKNPETLRWVPTNRRYAVTGPKAGGDGEDPPDDDDEALQDEGSATSGEKPNVPCMPTKHNPITVTVYGQMCASAKSYQSAIFYLLHAYDYSPEDPLICLSLAIASIGRAMQRQSDNRHHLITQGMAFLSRYRALRKSSPKGIDEIEFNFGRAFQQLGLYSHAAQHYERVFELAEGKPSDDPGLAREAAYNLGQIYVMTGAIPLAQAIYRKWLSF
ncbi:hypothetical protein PILCRDRAFT_812481 [Piloderma croceum F 1598]|uniref:TPR-like protein n=1 Tax=Piloderma croceum (strain F 1598) TaxID=765440 RepID=A0A0C3GD93_PILCF|nr:hypothetical protein PILCRDRAFT_812481 [Piloderma croceum F 1598]